jgi:hypothetical protein
MLPRWGDSPRVYPHGHTPLRGASNWRRQLFPRIGYRCRDLAGALRSTPGAPDLALPQGPPEAEMHRRVRLLMEELRSARRVPFSQRFPPANGRLTCGNVDQPAGWKSLAAIEQRTGMTPRCINH